MLNDALLTNCTIIGNSVSGSQTFGAGVQGQVTLPPNSDPSLAGMRVHHAALVLQLNAPVTLQFVTNALALDLVN